MTRVAEGAGVQRETLYRSLTEQGNPTFQTLLSVLDFLGLRIRISTGSSTEPSSVLPTSEVSFTHYADVAVTAAPHHGSRTLLPKQQDVAYGGSYISDIKVLSFSRERQEQEWAGAFTNATISDLESACVGAY
jgi:hypothetical protein